MTSRTDDSVIGQVSSSLEWAYGSSLWCLQASTASPEIVSTSQNSAIFGHTKSAGIFIAMILGVTYGFLKVTTLDASPGELLQLDLTWLILKIAFELGFGHYFAGPPREADRRL